MAALITAVPAMAVPVTVPETVEARVMVGLVTAAARVIPEETNPAAVAKVRPR